MRLNRILVIISLFVLSVACSKQEESKPQMAKAPAATAQHQATVQEVIQVTEYTYLRVTEGEKEYWMAVPKAEIKKGEVVLYNQAMEMKDFESKDLKRKFASIFFVDDLSTKLGAGSMNQPMKPTIEKQEIKIEQINGGVSIAQIFGNPSQYENKTITIKGKVTKVNTGIMKKNWLHIQDGTSSGQDFDLTVTTLDMAEVGQTIVLTGKIVLNKDFGYGYSYKVLLEDAKIANSL